jgi:FixJ family two-component response regulator
MTEEQPVVIVIDDDPSLRKAIDRLLRSVGLRVELFESAQEFLQNSRSNGPSCIVLDVRFPGQSGLNLLRYLTAADIHIPIIFITAHGDIRMSVRAMKAGAVEFLTKSFHDQDPLEAIQAALEKDRVRRADEKLIAELRKRFDTLTARERQVMQLVVAGRLNKQIAAELGISKMTVKIHSGQIFHKMQTVSLPDLVRMADKTGITKIKA